MLEYCHGHERKSRENVRKLEDGEIAISDENEGKGRGGGEVKNEKPLCWNVHHGNDSCLFMTRWRPMEPSNGNPQKRSGHAHCRHGRRKS